MPLRRAPEIKPIQPIIFGLEDRKKQPKKRKKLSDAGSVAGSVAKLARVIKLGAG